MARQQAFAALLVVACGVAGCDRGRKQAPVADQPVPKVERPDAKAEAAERQRKADAEARTSREAAEQRRREEEVKEKADAKVKTENDAKEKAALLAELRGQLAAARDVAGAAERQAREATAAAVKAQEKADKDYKDYLQAKKGAKFYQEYAKEDQQAARSKKEAKAAADKAAEADAAAKQAEKKVPDLTAEIERADRYSPEAVRGARKELAAEHFVGKWRLVDDKGKTSAYFTLTRTGAMKSNAPNVAATWEVVGDEARITWGDGWKDVLRFEKGGVVKLAFGPGASWDDAPANTQKALKEP
jgi:hypothetical protein